MESLAVAAAWLAVVAGTEAHAKADYGLSF
jgi:hypothetical protein